MTDAVGPRREWKPRLRSGAGRVPRGFRADEAATPWHAKRLSGRRRPLGGHGRCRSGRRRPVRSWTGRAGSPACAEETPRKLRQQFPLQRAEEPLDLASALRSYDARDGSSMCRSAATCSRWRLVEVTAVLDVERFGKTADLATPGPPLARSRDSARSRLRRKPPLESAPRHVRPLGGLGERNALLDVRPQELEPRRHRLPLGVRHVAR